MTAQTGKTYVVTIVDSSGSMTRYRDDTIHGYNGYLDQLAADPEHQFLVTTLKFASNTYMEYLAVDSAPADAPRLTDPTYQTRGNTALLDATMKAINDLQARVDLGEGDKVLIATVTDGEENDSRNVRDTAVVKTVIDALKATGVWEFVYLAQGIDSWRSASAMGYSVNTYVGTHSVDTRNSFRAAGATATRYAGGQSVNITTDYVEAAGSTDNVRTNPDD